MAVFGRTERSEVMTMMYGKPYSGPRWPGFDRVGVFIMGLVALGLYAFLILLAL
jgi:hypothetical protein